MTDLEALSNANNQLPYPRYHSDHGISWWKATILALCLLGVVGGILLWWRGGPTSSSDDPGFTCTLRNYQNVYQWVEIVNTRGGPLRIDGVKINGEYHSPRASNFSGDMARANPKVSWPQTITVGERAYAATLDANMPQSYLKTPIFVEVRTDRGTVRFPPD